MKIEHIAMYVNDLEVLEIFSLNTLALYVCNDGYYNSKTGFRSLLFLFDGAKA